jgi:DNA-binding transcriptional MerR regulator
MRVAEALREAGVDYIAEVEVAAACGESGAEAQAMLDDIYVQAAFDKLDRLAVIARTLREKRSVLREVEEQILPKVGDPAKAAEIRSKLAEKRARMQQEIAQAEQQRIERYSGCTELLATIQWNRARENDYEREENDFKRGCCTFLMANTSGWTGWMGSRLADEEIAKKQKLMQRYCAQQ